MALTLNGQIFLNIFTKYTKQLFLIQSTVIAVSYIQCFYGFENFSQEKEAILRNLTIIFIGILSFQVLNNHLVVINKKLILCGN